MDLGLAGKYALVTGGSHGIGLAVAQSLAGEGCNVAVCARNKPRLLAVVDRLEKSGVEVLGVEADASVSSEVQRAMKTLMETWPALHILVNNVGGGGRWGTDSIETTAEEVWLDVYSKNAMAAARFTRLALPIMRKQRWGRVVTITSIHGKEGGGRPWFNMAKSAEISLMKTLSMSQQLVRAGITFNSVAPGSIMIPETGWEKQMKENPSKFRRLVRSQYPLGRLGTPWEVAQVVAFLCSERASLVNGACVAVDGGESKSF